MAMGTPSIAPDPADSPKPTANTPKPAPPATPAQRRRRLLLYGAFVVCTAVLIGYFVSLMWTDKKLSDTAVARFHWELNAGGYEQIYDEATPELRASAPKAQILGVFEGVHQKLGNAVSAKFDEYKSNSTSSGTEVAGTYTSTYANGTVKETFTWMKKGNSLQLLRYHMSPAK